MKYFFSTLAVLTPMGVFAAEFQNLGDVLAWLLGLVNDYFIPLLVSLALLAFFWRNIVALAKKDELASKAETKWYLFWGVVALFVMVSVWGLVGILADAFGIKNVVPQLNTGSGEDGTDENVDDPDFIPGFTPVPPGGEDDPDFVPGFTPTRP